MADDDWASRIGRRITPSGAVVVPPRIAHWLEQKAGVTADRRIALRGTDAEAYEVLAALRLAALSHDSARADIGPKGVAGQASPQELEEQWITTLDAAQELGIDARTIRKWIATGRLQARRHGGRWLIRRNDLQIHKFAA